MSETITMAVIHSSFGGTSPVVSALHANEPSGISKSTEAVDPSVNSKTDEISGTKAKGPVTESGELSSAQDQQLVVQLKAADKRVKAHEMAHLRASGGYARGGPSYQFRQGPDGKKYAVAGEVQIDSGKESSPGRTITKMKIVQRAALAPADPSPQDRRVAAQASQNISEAAQEIRLEAVVQATEVSKADVAVNKDKSAGIPGSKEGSSPVSQKNSPAYGPTSGRSVNPPTLDIFA